MPWFRLKRGRWCGFGREQGPPPAVRLGWLRLDWLPEPIAAGINRFEQALRDARDEARRHDAEALAKDAAIAKLLEETRRLRSIFGLGQP